MSRSYLLAAMAAIVAFSGCATSSESAGAQQLSANVGNYGSPPAGIARLRAGVPGFEVTGSGSSAQMCEVAGDQLTTLLVNSGRLDVIERAQMGQLLKEQGMQGIVKADEVAKSGQVRGVDLLMIGKVTNFRVKAEKAKRGLGIGNLRLPGGGGIGAFDFKRSDSTITAECGVDLRLVDPSSGSIVAAKSKDFTRTDSIGAFGVQILGVNADADADLKLDEDNKGLLLRLALDDCLRDMMPSIDGYLVRRGSEDKR